MKFVEHIADDEVNMTQSAAQYEVIFPEQLFGRPRIATWMVRKGFKEFQLDNLRLIAVFESDTTDYGMVVGYIFGRDRTKLELPKWNDQLEIRNSVGESFNTYRIYWRDGSTACLKGRNEQDAFVRAGYGAGAMAAVDFFGRGEALEYKWNAADREWERMAAETITQE